MPKDELPSGGKFYAIVAQHLRAAQLGQYGASYTEDQLRNSLEGEARGFDKSFRNSDFVMISQQVDDMNALIDEAVSRYRSWIDAGKPEID